MSLFSRKPRDVSEVLLRLAAQLESAAADELDAVVIDVRHLEADAAG